MACHAGVHVDGLVGSCNELDHAGPVAGGLIDGSDPIAQQGAHDQVEVDPS